MLKKIIATGVAAAGMTGAVLLASPANAAQAGVKQTGHPIAACYSVSPYIAPAAYCIQPAYPYPGQQYGWHRWHHHWWHGWPHHRYYR